MDPQVGNGTMDSETVGSESNAEVLASWNDDLENLRGTDALMKVKEEYVYHDSSFSATMTEANVENDRLHHPGPSAEIGGTLSTSSDVHWNEQHVEEENGIGIVMPEEPALRTDPVISFVSTPTTVIQWNKMKMDHSFSDAQLAEFLIKSYQKSMQKDDACLMCQNPLSTYCDHCFRIVHKRSASSNYFDFDESSYDVGDEDWAFAQKSGSLKRLSSTLTKRKVGRPRKKNSKCSYDVGDEDWAFAQKSGSLKRLSSTLNKRKPGRPRKENSKCVELKMKEKGKGARNNVKHEEKIARKKLGLTEKRVRIKKSLKDSVVLKRPRGKWNSSNVQKQLKGKGKNSTKGGNANKGGLLKSAVVVLKRIDLKKEKHEDYMGTVYVDESFGIDAEEEEDDAGLETDFSFGLPVSPKSEPEVSFEPVTIDPAAADGGTTTDPARKDGSANESTVAKESGPLIIACVWCDLSFASISSMHEHLSEHSKPAWQRRQAALRKIKKKKWDKSTVHASKGDYACSLCGSCYKQPLILTKHLQNAHFKTPAFRCCACSQSFPSISLVEEHLSTRTCPQMKNVGRRLGDLKIKRPLSERPYQCRICLTRFRSVACLANHVPNHPEPDPFQCAMCLRSFSNMTELTGHKCSDEDTTSPETKTKNSSESLVGEGHLQSSLLEQVHEDLGLPYVSEGVNSTEASLSVGKSTNETSSRLAASSQSLVSLDTPPAEPGENTTTAAAASTATATSSTTTAPMETGSSSASGKPKRKRRYKPRPKQPALPFVDPHKRFCATINRKRVKDTWKYKCSYCSRPFKTELFMKKHIQVHTGQNAFPCDMCEETFRSQTAMLRHQEDDHWKGVIQCRECGMIFKSARTLLNHMTEHTGETPHECLECGERFTQGYYLTIHKRTHMGEKGDCYKCRECGETFLDRLSHKQHMKEHQGTARPYVCATCGSSFADSYALKVHIERTHQHKKYYVCEHCGRRFYSSTDHRTHVWRHIGYLPHACQLCGKRFIQRSLVQLHMRTVHSEERPFKCDQCPKAYKLKYRLKEHTRSAHTDERPFKCKICGKGFAIAGTRKNHMQTHKNEGMSIPESRRRVEPIKFDLGLLPSGKGKGPSQPSGSSLDNGKGLLQPSGSSLDNGKGLSQPSGSSF